MAPWDLPASAVVRKAYSGCSRRAGIYDIHVSASRVALMEQIPCCARIVRVNWLAMADNTHMTDSRDTGADARSAIRAPTHTAPLSRSMRDAMANECTFLV